MRVLVISPYPSVRAGLRALLQVDVEIDVAWEAAGPADLADPWPVQPDVALIDDAGDGSAVRTIAERMPDLPIVMLGGDLAQQRRGIQTAPRGFLTRDASGDELIAAVRAVARGLTVLDPSIARTLLGPAPSTNADSGPSADETLTHRELEVVQLLAAGLPNKTIAYQLGISEHTAKFHVSSVLAKLGAASRTEAVTIAARRGLLML